MGWPAITEAESRVMAAVWDGADRGAGGARVTDILASVGSATGWGESTVRTLIDRLIRKGALQSQRHRGLVVYVPMISREAWLTTESQGLLDRLFGGRLASMVAHLARERAMSPEDVARLRRLVAELDEGEED